MQQKKIPTKKENYRDKWFGTKPWLLIIFLLFGIASGIISLIRGVNKYKEN